MVACLYFVYNTWCSYADSITILSPQSLIDRHIEALKEALGRYVEEEKKSTYRLKKQIRQILDDF